MGQKHTQVLPFYLPTYLPTYPSYLRIDPPVPPPPAKWTFDGVAGGGRTYLYAYGIPICTPSLSTRTSTPCLRCAKRSASSARTRRSTMDHPSVGTCEQLGLDLIVDEGCGYQLSVHNDTLTFVYRHAGNALTVNLECSFGSGKGTPSAVTGTAPNFLVW